MNSVPQNGSFLDSLSLEASLISLFSIWTTTVQNFIPIYQQIWILQIFTHFSRFLAYNFLKFYPKIANFLSIQLGIIAYTAS